MEETNIISFLSNNVKYLLVDIGEEYQDKDVEGKPWFLSERGTFDWENIAPLLGAVHDDFNIHTQSNGWFASTVHKLWNIFHEAHHFLLRSDVLSQDLLWNLCSWTGKQNELKQHYALFVTKDMSTTETSLFLTALMERSLGNVFMLKGSQVPSLLRDLLETPELSSMLGHVPIIFLQILMGTPSALNLRNIVWHGFPRPDEIHPQLVSTLFLVTASVGEILNAKNISPDLIPRRIQKYFEPELFMGCSPVVDDKCAEALKILYESSYVASSHHTYWETALKHFGNGEYGFCLQLMMPQLEHLLRCIFCLVNDCPNRMLTAESTTLYTTLSEIMADQISVNNEVRENKIWDVLGYTVLEMLQDLFVHQAGPRIRDRVSHGECDLCDIPKYLVNHVICITLIIVLKSRGELSTSRYHQMSGHIDFPQSCSGGCGRAEPLEMMIMHTFENYSSMYHPSSVLKKSIITVMNCLDEWQKYPRPFRDECDLVASENFLQFHNKIHNSLKDLDWAIDDTSQGICEHVLSVKIHTTFRPKTESEIISILKHVVDNIQLIVSQVNQQLLEKFQSYSQHKMRSRNRDTYQRMLQIIPYLKRIIVCVIIIVMIWLHKINLVFNMPCEKYCQSLKFFKKILQFVENVASYTSQNKNRWSETVILADKFCQETIQAMNTHFYLLKQI